MPDSALNVQAQKEAVVDERLERLEAELSAIECWDERYRRDDGCVRRITF
jgi:hypothetical protein